VSDERKAAIILAAIAGSEGTWLFFSAARNPAGFLRYCGASQATTFVFGWIVALAVTVAFTMFAARLPSVRANLFRFSGLKLLAIAVAIASGFCEEVIFRKFLMDSLAGHGYNVTLQIAVSALAFGAVHGVWGLFRGSLGTAVGATVVTGALGLAFALVYVASHRVVLPCIVGHGLINLMAEPGLVLAAVRGEMGRASIRSQG
jgi:membrane protease YdiL (CAAX protease family)